MRSPLRPSELGQRYFFALSQPNARAAAVLVDEFDAGKFESSLQHIKCRAARVTSARLKLPDGYDANARVLRELLLGPVEETARSPTLVRRDHDATMQKSIDLINSVEIGLTNLHCRL